LEKGGDPQGGGGTLYLLFCWDSFPNDGAFLENWKGAGTRKKMVGEKKKVSATPFKVLPLKYQGLVRKGEYLDKRERRSRAGERRREQSKEESRSTQGERISRWGEGERRGPFLQIGVMRSSNWEKNQAQCVIEEGKGGFGIGGFGKLDRQMTVWERRKGVRRGCNLEKGSILKGDPPPLRK